MDDLPTVGEQLRDLTELLQESSDTASLEAQLLVAHAAGKSRSWVLAHPEVKLTATQNEQLIRMLAAVRLGKPLPYVLGEWDFYGLRFTLQPSVLIPRPETELIVEKALSWCQRQLSDHPGSIRAVDVGTGSGCIAVSIAVHQPQTRWVASDISWMALQVARENVRHHRVAERVRLVQADLLSTFNPGAFDLVCANLPYIPSETLRELPIYGREPALALDGGQDGLDMICLLLQQASTRLVPGGLLLAEIETTQGPAAVSLAKQAFPKAQIHLHLDYAGHDRLLEINLPTQA